MYHVYNIAMRQCSRQKDAVVYPVQNLQCSLFPAAADAYAAMNNCLFLTFLQHAAALFLAASTATNPRVMHVIQQQTSESPKILLQACVESCFSMCNFQSYFST